MSGADMLVGNWPNELYVGDKAGEMSSVETDDIIDTLETILDWLEYEEGGAREVDTDRSRGIVVIRPPDEEVVRCRNGEGGTEGGLDVGPIVAYRDLLAVRIGLEPRPDKVLLDPARAVVGDCIGVRSLSKPPSL